MKIDVLNLCQSYTDVKVIEDINFSLESGEVVGLLGPNGCGKSTLIKTIADILTPKSGKILIDGKDSSTIDQIDRAKLIGYVPQHFNYGAFTTVLETVLIGRRPNMSWFVSEDDLHAVEQALQFMGIEDLSERYVSALSGGQRQRVFIARAIAQKPAFYLFDEPTSALDLRHQIDTLDTMQRIVRADNSGMIVALHDLNLAMRYTDKIMLLSGGNVYAYGNSEDVLTPESVMSVYGVKADVIDTVHGKFILPYNDKNKDRE